MDCADGCFFFDYRRILWSWFHDPLSPCKEYQDKNSSVQTVLQQDMDFSIKCQEISYLMCEKMDTLLLSDLMADSPHHGFMALNMAGDMNIS